MVLKPEWVAVFIGIRDLSIDRSPVQQTGCFQHVVSFFNSGKLSPENLHRIIPPPKSPLSDMTEIHVEIR